MATRSSGVIIPGEVYRHYKGNLYRVIGVGLTESTLQKVVIYRALYDDAIYGKNVIWTRPKKDFLSKVSLENGRLVDRFTVMLDE